jgi:hypothetical protein
MKRWNSHELHESQEWIPTDSFVIRVIRKIRGFLAYYRYRIVNTAWIRNSGTLYPAVDCPHPGATVLKRQSEFRTIRIDQL